MGAVVWPLTIPKVGDADVVSPSGARVTGWAGNIQGGVLAVQWSGCSGGSREVVFIPPGVQALEYAALRYAPPRPSGRRSQAGLRGQTVETGHTVPAEQHSQVRTFDCKDACLTHCGIESDLDQT